MRVSGSWERGFKTWTVLGGNEKRAGAEGTAAMYSQWELVISPSPRPNDSGSLIILLALIGEAPPLFLIISARPRASHISVWAACWDCELATCVTRGTWEETTTLVD